MFAKKIAQGISTQRRFGGLAQVLVLLGIFVLTTVAYAASLTASVDRSSIGLRETLTLTLSAEGQSKTTPDFSGLKNDFDILSSQRSSSIQIINGAAQSSTDWQLVLAPKRAGTLLIPSFNLNNVVSDAIEISVSQQSQTQQSDSDEQVKTVVEIDKNSAYVQEQVLVTIKLITQVNLSQAKVQPLELNNALVVDLGQKQYQTEINGTQHLVVESSFAIYPQESGQLTIPSLSYDVALEDARSIWGNAFGRNRSNIMRLRTAEKHIEVKAIPGQHADKIWQPATNLSVQETWSNSLNQVKIGEPITRTIIIQADALTAAQIAPIASSTIDGLTFYPDQAQTKDNKSNKGVQGSRIETMAIVANSGGDFTLPAINIDWWNTSTQKMETATLPAKTIHVLGQVAPAASAASAATLHALEPAAATTTNDSPPAVTAQPISLWILILLGLFALLSVTLAIYIVKLKKNIQQLVEDQAERDNELQEKERDIWDALKTTAATRDANALRKAVLQWANFQWPAQTIHTLDDISKLGMNEALTTELKALDAMLYSNHGNSEWDASVLLKLLNDYRKQKKHAKKSPELKNLYSQ